MKRFVFDRLVDRENICNLAREQEALRAAVARQQNVIVYAPRNYGKTSVVKNIIIEDFRKEHPKRFVFFADLMEVKSQASLVRRLTAAFERSFEESFPMRSLVENTKRYLTSLRPELSFDEVTGKPSLSLQHSEGPDRQTFQSLFAHLRKIAAEMPTLIVLDEFQDIARVEETPGLFREALEGLAPAPIILMGSKRHMLFELFAQPGAPLAGWGTDLEFDPIPYEEYRAYINERFKPNRLHLAPETARVLQDSLRRVPEAINRLCQQILDLHENREITLEDIGDALRKLLQNRASRYEAYLAGFSVAEEKVLIRLAAAGIVEKPQSKAFLSRIDLSNRSVAQIFRRLSSSGVVEKDTGGYRLSDPLLEAYLRSYR